MIQHLAWVMDGNGRWATSRGLPTVFGHKQGVSTVRTVVEFCVRRNIPYLTLYTFSLENFKRSLEEKSYLFTLIGDPIVQVTKELIGQDIRVCFIGDRSVFPESLRSTCDALEQATTL